MWQNVAKFRQFMLANSDTVPMRITETNWPYGSAGVMTPQLQAQFLRTILQTLSGYDSINAVAFSEYLKAVCIYEQTEGNNDFGLIVSGVPNPAVAVLTTVVAGE
jgi:hypothetical protein